MQPYYVRDSMLDPVEQSLYRALTLVLCQRALLFTKINLGDLFMASPYGQAGSQCGGLEQQRVDFVLCDRDSIRPLAVILFAADPARSGQADYSEQIVQVCTDAGLPVVRLQRQSTYLMHQLTPLIESVLTANAHRNDFTNGDRLAPATGSSGMVKTTMSATHIRRRKQPAYPGYGALKTIANKPV